MSAMEDSVEAEAREQAKSSFGRFWVDSFVQRKKREGELCN